MKVIYKHHNSKIAALSITFNAGARVENDKYPNGIAHLMEHMRFKKTKNFSAKEFAKEVAYIGGDCNAYTSEDMVNYHIELPEDNIGDGFKLLNELAFNISLNLENLEKEKTVVCQEIRSYKDNISYEVSRKLYSGVFKNNLSKSVVGSEESVNSITLEQLEEFDKEFYNKDNAILTISANKPFGEYVEKYFGVVDNKCNSFNEAENVQYALPFEAVVIKEGNEQNHIYVAYGDQKIANLVKEKRAALKVFNQIFGTGMDSRLFSKVREDLGLVYGIYSTLHNSLDGSLFVIGTSTEPENKEKVMSAIDQVISEFATNPPAVDEIKKAKNMLKADYYRLLDTSMSVAHNALYKEIYNYSDNIELLKEVDNVSVDDVMNIYNTIFSSNKYTVIGKGK